MSGYRGGPPRGGSHRGGGPPRGGGGGRGRGGGRAGKPQPGPNVGTRSPLSVVANTFAITQLPKVAFFQYQVSFAPEARTIKKQRIVIDHMQRQHTAQFSPPGVYDGQALFFSQRDDVGGNWAVDLPAGPNGQAGGTFHVKLERVSDIRPLSSKEVGGNNALNPVIVNLLQLLSQEKAARDSSYFNPRRSVFFPRNAHPVQLPGRTVDMLHGFFQSIKPVRNGLVVNLDIASTLMYNACPLFDWIMNYMGFRDIRNLEAFTPAHPGWRDLKSKLNNLRVEYKSDRVRQRKIRGIVARAGDIEFQRGDERITVEMHFQQLNRPLRFPKILGVYLDDKKTVVVPVELCEIIPGQRYPFQLGKNDQTAALEQMTQTPANRLNTIQNGIAFFAHHDSPHMLQAMMSVAQMPTVIQAHRIGAPRVVYRENLSQQVLTGEWDIGQNQFLEAMDIKSWVIINMAGPDVNTRNGNVRTEEHAANFMRALTRSCRQRGMRVPESPPAVIDMQGMQERTLTQIKHGQLRPPAVMFFFLGDGAGASELHRQIKYWGDIQEGVTTQCMFAGKVNPTGLFGNNIAMKLNAKLGGVNNVASNPSLDSLSSGTMIIGADVTHPGPGAVTRPSIASVVVSLDKHWAKYYSFMDVQPPRVERIENLRDLIYTALQRWWTVNGKRLPQRIIYFRDGISEGQYVDTGEYEELHIRQAWERAAKELNLPFKFDFTFIVVEKRHHLRFLPHVGQQTLDNIPPGLLVEDQVISRVYDNFYLVSQAGILGTSRPSHYVVLKRNPTITLAMIQDLSYYLCHVCARTTRSVALPAPVHYADLLAAEAFNYIAPNSPALNLDNMTVATDDEFNLDVWKRALPTGPVVHKAMQGKLFFV
ncbi:Piwi-domain-containing protein [Peniophora sp. CONT]|nr:Piwi-domain-containing protein [Peniophora sp. CONT]